MATRTQAQAATTKIVWGACPKSWKNGNPQFAATKMLGEVLAMYHPKDKVNYPETQVRKVAVTFTKAAKNVDVERAATTIKLDIDWNDASYAETLSTHVRLRNQLRRDGFDAYMDRCVIEDCEPVQIVVFNKAQATIL